MQYITAVLLFVHFMGISWHCVAFVILSWPMRHIRLLHKEMVRQPSCGHLSDYDILPKVVLKLLRDFNTYQHALTLKLELPKMGGNQWQTYINIKLSFDQWVILFNTEYQGMYLLLLKCCFFFSCLAIHLSLCRLCCLTDWCVSDLLESFKETHWQWKGNPVKVLMFTSFMSPAAMKTLLVASNFNFFLISNIFFYYKWVLNSLVFSTVCPLFALTTVCP